QLPTKPTLFPYTTLFRSDEQRLREELHEDRRHRPVAGQRTQEIIPAGAGRVRDHAGAVVHDGAERRITCPTGRCRVAGEVKPSEDRKSTRLNSSHEWISY